MSKISNRGILLHFIMFWIMTFPIYSTAIPVIIIIYALLDGLILLYRPRQKCKNILNGAIAVLLIINLIYSDMIIYEAIVCMFGFTPYLLNIIPIYYEGEKDARH